MEPAQRTCSSTAAGSLEVEIASVLDDFYWSEKDDPNLSLRRITRNRGEPDRGRHDNPVEPCAARAGEARSRLGQGRTRPGLK